MHKIQLFQFQKPCRIVHHSEQLLKVISLFPAGTFTTCRFASTTARSAHTDADRIDGSLTQSSRS
jgi:hypothetical protein